MVNTHADAEPEPEQPRPPCTRIHSEQDEHACTRVRRCPPQTHPPCSSESADATRQSHAPVPIEYHPSSGLAALFPA
eukprot:3271650-Rhodomonas_salina.4